MSSPIDPLSASDADPKAKRRAQVAASVARHKLRMDSLSRLEQAAWKGRKFLGDDYDPYTPEERQHLANIRDLEAALSAAAAHLNALLIERLRGEVTDNPGKAVLLAALEVGPTSQLNLPPY